MNTGPLIGSLCTGYGGLDLGVLAALGTGRIAWCADNDPHIATVLAARMPGVPNLGDLRAVDWTAVRPVDVVTAGFPCQDISAAGRRAGIEKGTRSGLWRDIMAALRVLRPPLVVVENVAALRWRGGGLDRVLADLAEAGYDTVWRSVRAADVGAPHLRERLFLLAWPRLGPPAAAHTPRQRHRHPRPPTRPRFPATAVPPDPPLRPFLGATAADATGFGWREWFAQLPRQQGPPLPARGGPQPAPDTPDGNQTHQRPSGTPPGRTRRRGRGEPGAGAGVGSRCPAPRVPRLDRGARVVDFGGYEPAIQRWEHRLNRPAPDPTTTGQRQSTVLNPAIVEWMMGLPEGWVTALPLPRTAQLHALGNGVVPQQAAHAVDLLLDDLAALLHHDALSRTRREATAA
ncbi:DNA cytosine methyltransferase [Saccharothrix sp. SC076]|nr:DNA cytosine methyltransferase [Saccharothrix obliqua]